MSSSRSIEIGSRRGALRALVVDSEPLWRDTLAALLARLGVATIAVCESSLELGGLLRSWHPHLVLLDAAEAPRMVMELHRVRRLLPHLATVLVTRGGSETLLPELEVAASVDKRSELAVIEGVLHAVIGTRLGWGMVTPRQLEILKLVGEGASNREVAQHLWLSDETVRFHLKNAYKKLGVNRREDAVKRAAALGLLAEDRDDEPDSGGEGELRGRASHETRSRRSTAQPPPTPTAEADLAPAGSHQYAE